MTKEDEARLARIREEHTGGFPITRRRTAFLLRLLDEQAARIAALENAGSLMRLRHGERCTSDDLCPITAQWDAAIRARVETPIGAVVEGVLDRRSDLMHQLAAAPQAGKPPVAPGEVKP